MLLKVLPILIAIEIGAIFSKILHAKYMPQYPMSAYVSDTIEKIIITVGIAIVFSVILAIAFKSVKVVIQAVIAAVLFIIAFLFLS